MKLTTDCRVSLVKDTKFRSQQAAMQFLAQFLVDNPKIKVIFIDTLRYFFGTREVSQKNAQDQDFEMLEPLRELAKSANVTIIAMLHEKKPQMNQGPERMTINEAVGGSALIAGTFYSIIRIVKPKKQLRKGITTGYIELQGRETANDESIQVKSDKQAGRWIELDDLEQAAVTALAELRSGTIAASIISELQAAGGELTRFELREKLKFQGHGVDAIKKALQRAAGTGKVHLIGETDLSPVRLVVQ